MSTFAEKLVYYVCVGDGWAELEKNVDSQLDDSMTEDEVKDTLVNQFIDLLDERLVSVIGHSIGEEPRGLIGRLINYAHDNTDWDAVLQALLERAAKENYDLGLR